MVGKRVPLFIRFFFPAYHVYQATLKGGRQPQKGRLAVRCAWKFFVDVDNVVDNVEQ